MTLRGCRSLSWLEWERKGPQSPGIFAAVVHICGVPRERCGKWGIGCVRDCWRWTRAASKRLPINAESPIDRAINPRGTLAVKLVFKFSSRSFRRARLCKQHLSQCVKIGCYKTSGFDKFPVLNQNEHPCHHSQPILYLTISLRISTCFNCFRLLVSKIHQPRPALV